MNPRKTRRLSRSICRPSARQRPSRLALRLTPYAWAKLLFLRDLGPTEVGGFGIAPADDLLLIEDFALVRQLCTEITIRLDDVAVADYFDDQVDRRRKPEQFGRIWIHTHPGDSPTPSGIDEATFDRCFGAADWSLMFIVARGGRTYARLQFRVGPGGQLTLPVEIDFCRPFPAAAMDEWKKEYERCVRIESRLLRERDRLTAGQTADSFAADELAIAEWALVTSSLLSPQEPADDRIVPYF